MAALLTPNAPHLNHAWLQIYNERMTKLTPLSFVAITLVLAGCTTTTAIPDPAADDASAWTIYACESGKQVAATYPTTETARVRYQGQEHQMQIAISGSGARYVSDTLEWWTKGSETGAMGTLLTHQADGTSGDVLENCIAT